MHPRFACDAMMRGLARWLRASGYDATWTYGIDDDELIAQARAEDRVLITADRGIVGRRALRRAGPAVLYVPNDLPPIEQARLVLETFALPRRAPRCMACGGEVVEVEKRTVEHEAPPRTYARTDRFFRCRRCGRLLWRGTHWHRIRAMLERLD